MTEPSKAAMDAAHRLECDARTTGDFHDEIARALDAFAAEQTAKLREAAENLLHCYICLFCDHYNTSPLRRPIDPYRNSEVRAMRAALSEPESKPAVKHIRAVIEANWSADTKDATAEAVLGLFTGATAR